MTSTSAFIAAMTDTDLLARIRAAAQMAGISNADAWATANLAAILMHETTDTPIADVYAYAKGVRDAHIAATPLPPGADPAAVTDEMLAEAVEALRPQS